MLKKGDVMQFNKNEINIEINESDAKNVTAYSTSNILKNYLALINKMNNELETMSKHEMGLFCKSMYRWLCKKDLINVPDEDTISIGEIYMIDWGVNYKPELSYFHPAVILEEINNMYLVIPTSSKPTALSKAYHPCDNPKGKWYYRKVGIEDGFLEECILLLDNIKVVSKTRIMKKIGRLTCTLNDEQGLYREIRKTIIKNAFRGEYKKFESLSSQVVTLHEDNELLKRKILELQTENEALFLENQNWKEKFQQCS